MSKLKLSLDPAQSDILFIKDGEAVRDQDKLCITFPQSEDQYLVSKIYLDGIQTGQQRALYDPAYKQGEDIFLQRYKGMQIGIMIGSDIESPEAARLAKLRGAELLLYFGNSESLKGAWNAAQSNCLYVLQIRDQLTLFSPCGITEDQSGIEKKADAYEVSSAQLKKAHEDFPIFDSLNPEWYIKEAA